MAECNTGLMTIITCKWIA